MNHSACFRVFLFLFAFFEDCFPTKHTVQPYFWLAWDHACVHEKSVSRARGNFPFLPSHPITGDGGFLQVGCGGCVQTQVPPVRQEHRPPPQAHLITNAACAGWLEFEKEGRPDPERKQTQGEVLAGGRALRSHCG